ncbi:PAS domain-containing sensor histidine kinase [Haloplanus ruber]|uniref:histidine kinase n=1 Tax=Haloplanus ruber TaxID=869892 RepID=A0ABD6D0Y2_9EURY|nr:PAS domain-containing sensor histidine kinase [Haloplanus ruber]
MGGSSLGNQHNFRTLFDQLDGVALWTATEPGTFEYVSDGFEDIWELPPDAVRDDVSRLLEAVHPDDRAQVRANIEGSERGQGLQDRSYEGRVVRPDGSIRWVLTQQEVLRDSEGEVSEVVGVCTDITEQKRREEELEMLNRIVRHDIRNDLSVMVGWAEALEDHVDDEAQDHLEKILNSGRHVIELTKIARDYAETVVSEEVATTEPTPIRDVLETELSLRRESFPEAEFVVHGPLPDVEVPANGMLGSVFRNLLNNAVQHNDADTPVVDVSCELDDGAVAVRIADNGPGIPDEHKEVVFGKGEKGLGSPGTGIGLYLVHTLVDQYGGEVWAEDNDPTGAVFVVELPEVTE